MKGKFKCRSFVVLMFVFWKLQSITISWKSIRRKIWSWSSVACSKYQAKTASLLGRFGADRKSHLITFHCFATVQTFSFTIKTKTHYGTTVLLLGRASSNDDGVDISITMRPFNRTKWSSRCVYFQTTNYWRSLHLTWSSEKRSTQQIVVFTL